MKNSDLNILISCLCPTKNHPSIVINAITDFKKQNWKNRELILVTDEKSEYIETLRLFECKDIKLFLAPHKSTIGALRNISMEKAQGEYVAIWDDDDGHHEDRLSMQYANILNSGKKACYLKKVLVHDTITGDKGISKNWRGTEGSMLALKSIVPKYNEAENIAEDTPVKNFLATNGHITLIDEPQLYTYRFHDSNTCQRRHLLNLIDTII
jgi:glycosyltransferase involved in cell wall biosynthesis